MDMRIVRFARLAVFAALSTVVSSHACVWCTPNAPIPALSYLKAQARNQINKSKLLSKDSTLKRSMALAERSLPAYLAHEGVCFTNEPKNRFYTEYLCAYYPRMKNIIELLIPTMCPDAFGEMLHSLTYFISTANWRYFVNNPADITLELVHVDILFDQLNMLAEALGRASVDSTTGLVMLAAPGQRAPAHASLIRHLEKKKKNELHDSYALFLDFIVRLAYINVLHQDSTGAYRYTEQLKRNLSLVRGTKYEQLYTQVSKLYQDLLKMLRQRAWGTESGGKKIAYATTTTLEQWAKKSQGMDELVAYAHSFISQYECNVTGKFTHEYHPFMLDKTADSFRELEHRFADEKMPIVGRLMLMGYEEQGVPRYYTDFGDAYFADEMVAKTSAGYSLQQFNRFGLLTGFLCKHANDMSAYAAHHYGQRLPLTHINADMVEIFDGFGTLFQEHAFGDAYTPVMFMLPRVEHQLVRMAMPQLCRELMRFWQTLYNNELRITGKQHVAGTQDILFSIAYMRHLQQSTTPIIHFYMGPDITYPIETSSLHKKEVTRHAQSFVKKFVPEQMVARDSKKTAYVFCSFVDGVGKSTMLGNVQNWMEHGDKIEEYEHVDNSSSQLATVFSFSDEVVIADLPAQVSHFTYKPDGQVYAIIAALRDDAEQQHIIDYVVANEKQLAAAHAKKLKQARVLYESHGYDLTVTEEQDPELSFMMNLLLLDKEKENKWISFVFEDEYYLYHPDTKEIRQRVPLATAPSAGLKNSTPEQMIFSLGVRFPLSYQTFVDDLVKQLQEKGVEQVVMVDFLSMYSRSSRENIRVNYIIQQLALLYKDFSLRTSFYQDFVNNAQLLGLLEQPDTFADFHKGLAYESWVRILLYDILRECHDDSIEAVSIEAVTQKIQNKIATMPEHLNALVKDLTHRKLTNEYANLREAYGETRAYVAVQQFCANDLVTLSRKISSLFTKKVANEDINELWGMVRSAKTVVAGSAYKDSETDREYAQLDNGVEVEVLGRLVPDCKDAALITPLVRQVRACWYAALSNLLFSYRSEETDKLVVRERVPVPPVIAVTDENNNICVVQLVLEPVDGDEYPMPDYSLFEVTPEAVAQDWSLFKNRLYLTNWRSITTTHAGLYGAGHEVYIRDLKDNEDPWRSRPIVSALYIKFAKEEGDEKVLVHEKLFDLFGDKLESFKANFDAWKKEASQNGEYHDDTPFPSAHKKDQSGRVQKDEKIKLQYLRDEQVPGAREFVRALATIDLYLKDPEADLASRRGNRKDFAANLQMIEWITLPWLLQVLPAQPLFSNYEAVPPLIELSKLAEKGNHYLASS